MAELLCAALVTSDLVVVNRCCYWWTDNWCGDVVGGDRCIAGGQRETVNPIIYPSGSRGTHPLPRKSMLK